MIHRTAISSLALAALAAGCNTGTTPDAVTRVAVPPAELDYRGIETRLLEDDLVQFLVETGPDATREDVVRYAECAAAQYALIRGYGFARHVQTRAEQTETGWHGEAVYTISPGLPEGVRTIDAEVVAGNCAENGIPMV